MTAIQKKQKKTHIPDKEIVELYRTLFPKAAGLIQKMGGDYSMAQDTFQDALIIYFEDKYVKKEIENPEGYIMGIIKHLWFRKHQQESRLECFPGYTLDIAEKVEDYLQPVPTKLLSMLEKTGKKCLDLLQAFYFKNQSLQNIARSFGFAGTRSATVQKYKCLEKVRDTVKKEGVLYADFFE